MAVALKRGRVKRWIFESITEKFTGAVPNNSDDFKSRMLRRNPYIWLFETTGAAAPKSGNSECQKVVDMIPVPPQQASREHQHSQNDGKHGGSMKRGRVKRQIFESIIENFTGAVPNNSDDFKSCMLRWNPYVWLFETTGAAAPEYGNSECQEVVDMIPVPPQQASREHEHSQNDGKHGGSVFNTIISGNIIYANNSTRVGISHSNSMNEVREIRNLVLVFEGLKRPLDPYDCFHIEVADQIIGNPFIESSLTDPIENNDTLTAQTKTIEVMYR